MTNPPAVIDTNVFSNFAITGNINILETLYKQRLYIPTIVIQECQDKSELRPYISNAISKGWLKEFVISYTSTPDEFIEHTKIRKRFHPGESAILAIAKVNNFIVISDDITGVKNYCKANGLRLKGSLGILYEAYSQKLITVSQGNKIIQDMINFNNYKCPVQSMQEVINWFVYCIGKELF
ncbi:putative nucleic acid-binding protein, contains PIN domain [Thermoanaerobacter sp. YS13]|uniref:hypothetical protein n=1 Tax=Thermoanaerobacter sp. YS13 TaxID=1511746 RepID=UPI00057379D0|nr:hypothetical protein [Thermoanaerobacter sp. YS13]KHO63256.1 putative nucleic acid-binding protein, contains PIN domain [Thermoanaerobacter sp. YS13]